MHMRQLVVALGFLCVVFAGTTIYYASELADERARASAGNPGRIVPAPAPATAPHAPAATIANAGQVARIAAAAITPEKESAPDHPIRPPTDEEIKASQLQFAKAFLEQVGNPQAREDLVAERRMQMRQTFPALERVVGLSADEYSRLLTLLAEEQVQVQAEHSRCVVDPDCNSQQWNYSNQTHQQEIAQLLGADRAQRFETYKNTLGERESITQMRVRLSDSQRLSDANAEGLIAALAEERALMSRETSQRGGGSFGFGIGSGMLYAPSEGTPDTQYEAARQYSQRLRDRATSYLNSEQLRLFNEMQDEQLVAFRNMLRNKNVQYDTVTYSLSSPSP
jgi:hypothetical protein